MKKIEIEGHGKFIVLLETPLVVVELVDPSPARCGFMVGHAKPANQNIYDLRSHNPHSRNALRKMSSTTGRTFPVLFKSREMAEEICHILNQRL